MKLRASRRPWTLRTRLLVSVVALFTLLSVIVGGISVLFVYSNQIQRVDEQFQRIEDVAIQPRFGNTAGCVIGNTPGLQQGSIVALSTGTTIKGLIPEFGGDAQDLKDSQVAPMLTIKTNNTPTNLDIPGEGAFRVVRVSYSSTSCDATHEFIAYPLDQINKTTAGFAVQLGLISLVGILLVAFATWFIVSYALRPLRRVAATATEVASMELDRGEVDLSVRVPEADTDTRTEVGQVGAALNTMLGHVGAALQARQASESRVRQFVADASHELRTPLASIRGYAELTRRGNYDLPKDVTHSLGRVESEAVRMTSLVEDLLLLARLDAGRDIETAPVDLTRILVDCVSDAHAAGPDHKWELGATNEALIVEGDAERLHQVFVNLLANARVHTPAGTRVKISLEKTDRATAVVTIADNGPGIPKNLQTDLFERFARGDSSRSRASGSTGLGLAIVQAVVDAHRGSVSVSSRKGNTTFKVELPLALSE
jgi:two-component system OmpR family sensor kinase